MATAPSSEEVTSEELNDDERAPGSARDPVGARSRVMAAVVVAIWVVAIVIWIIMIVVSSDVAEEMSVVVGVISPIIVIVLGRAGAGLTT